MEQTASTCECCAAGGERRQVPTIEPRRVPNGSSTAAYQRIVTLATRLETTRRQTGVMECGYRVRSKLPVLGPCIVWIRHNLASHLLGLYLDPSLERQVALNRELIATLGERIRL